MGINRRACGNAADQLRIEAYLDPAGCLSVTDDYLRAYYLRPEVHPVEESSDAERVLHAALMEDPQRPVSARELNDLQEVEARVADNGSDDRAPPQVHEAPERAQHARGDGCIHTLQQMTGSECQARDDHTHRRAAQPLFEATQQECALQFLAHAASDDDDKREQPCISRPADQIL